METISIPLEKARNLILKSQLLDGAETLPEGRQGILHIINKLGYVQIDTIAIIKRAHHHTFWTRALDYHENMLHDLQTTDRAVFEYWGHAMSYLPMSDYRFFLPRMKNFENPSSKWAKHQFQQSGHLLQPVLERIRDEGPLSSKDFSHPSDKKGGTWWDWKPAKVALELLFWRGDLMITERKNFQKIYDLTERVLPSTLNVTMPDKEELGRFLVKRALSAFGVANAGEIQKYLQPETSRDSDLQVANKDVLKTAINHLLEEKEITPIKIEGIDNSVFYAQSAALKYSAHLQSDPPRIHLLSPFDNLIIQRDRLKSLFGFDYTLECYLPEKKRKFGYFTLPILFGERFVARLDPKADRKKKTLLIQNLVFEPHFNEYDKFFAVFANKLAEFARFNVCESIQFEKVSPAKIKTSLNRAVKNVIGTGLNS
ncbi:MAG: winged helix-turn-helix domain-containing protein [Calditrichaceae bacterium]